MTDKFFTPCGQDCRKCGLYNEDCQGCMSTAGVPCWMEHVPMDTCPIFICAVVDREKGHCGNCEDYPCKTYLDLRDPSMSDEQWDNSLAERRENLMIRKGTES